MAVIASGSNRSQSSECARQPGPQRFVWRRDLVILTLGLLFLFVPFIVNAVLLWLTDKLLRSFEIETLGGLFASAAIITLANWLFHMAIQAHFAAMPGPGPTRWI